jgi:hypothetical protein
MNMKLAAQVLNNSVGSVLQFCKSLGDPNFKNVDPTAEFCFMINIAFDILNSSNLTAEPKVLFAQHWTLKSMKNMLS